ncbi:AtpZ/AtpI family protein [Rubinisphaera sp. JC750]|uniref:AtpZ/AtpI family protein n=1 Tax=Rubinisphaera sp. JC750 TaxID=2898658 RepID=UPI001F3B133E|nr:AtpZ/AtpI family protein [Rubinisphaera sp. JC750]
MTESSSQSNPPAPPDPPPSPLLEAMRMLSHITTAIALMLVSGSIGYGLDLWLGWTFFSLLGFAGGGFLGVRHLIQQTSD